MYSYQEIYQKTRQSAAEVLCMNEQDINDDKRLPELGMDSIIGVELIVRLNRFFGCHLEKNVIYDYPTINKLVKFIESQINHNISSDSAEPLKALSDDGYFQQLKEKGQNSPEWSKVMEAITKIFGTVPDDLLMRFSNLSDLAVYLSGRNETYPEPQAAEKFYEKKVVLKKNQIFREEHLETSQDIAVVGISGRFPQSEHLDSFWNHLLQGDSLISEIPPERWDWKEYAAESGSKWGGFIKNIDQFDPLFFHISPREAVQMDPQIRLLLETIWETLEDSGNTREGLKKNGRTGLFVGCIYQHYHLLNSARCANQLFTDSYWSLVNRCSHFFDFQGPSVAVDTACSSSMTAIHMACESIRRGECSAAVAGGVNLSLHPQKYIALKQFQMLSGEERSCTWGNGDGYIPGEGVATVLLKPLETAIRDQDHIYGIIKSSSINHGGTTDGFTVPNGKAQQELMEQTLKKAHVLPESISYIETSTVGLPEADKQELDTLLEVFRDKSEKTCAVGCVKANTGHLEAASGISQLTKVLLQLKHKTLVPVINTEGAYGKITAEHSPFFFAEQAEKWQKTAENVPRRAIINSFGAGGANACLLLEEYEPVSGPGRGEYSTTKNGAHQMIVILSGHSKECLKQQAAGLLSFLPQCTDIEGLAYTLQIGREAMESRLAMLCSDEQELKCHLQAFLSETEAGGAGWCTGQIPEEDGEQPADSLNQSAAIAVREKDYIKIMELWTGGATVDWTALYTIQPYKISLPSSPFCRKRYWLEVETRESPLAVQKAEDVRQEPFVSTAPKSGKLEEIIVNTLADLLEVDSGQISHRKKFRDLGLNSVLVTEFAEHLDRKLGIYVNPVDIFNYPTVEKLTGHLAGEPVHIGEQENFSRSSDSVEKYSENHGKSDESVAVIGMSCCFPGAENLEKFWQNLMQGRDSITKIPDNRPGWQHGSDQSLYPWGGFLAEPTHFDAQYFGIPKSEADKMDPQQKFILEQTRRALDHAGYTASDISGSNWGVFIGAGSGDFNRYRPSNELDAFTMLGESNAVTAGRISYFYDLHGPCLTIDTACSSSLTALHQAVNSIHTGESTAAIIGGVCILSTQAMHVMTEHAGMLSADGKLRAFDQNANGFVPGEGAGVIIIKSLERAVKDGDHIYGVIKGTAVNQDGQTNGITAPNGKAQYDLISGLYQRIGLDPQQVGYIEAHGTGTRLGDPIEINALAEVFHSQRTERKSCAIGSVKTNIGHSLTSAGMAGLIKTILCIYHKKLVPSLHFEQPNEYINFADSPFYVNTCCQDWKAQAGQPRIAGVSSFGFSGTNAHVVVAEYVGKSEETTFLPQQPQEDKEEQLLSYLKDTFQKVTGFDMEKIDIHEPFDNHGIHSLVSKEIISCLEKDFGPLPATLLFEHFTLSDLKDYLIKRYQPQVPQASDPDRVAGEEGDIAVIGMAGRYPQADDLDEFWNNLKNGSDCIEEIPLTRWDHTRYYDPDPALAGKGKIYSKWGGFVNGVDQFDPLFFRLSHREAEQMDPQERLFLETAWEALVNAGCSGQRLKQLKRRVGVFAGVTSHTYQYLGKDTVDEKLWPDSSAWSVANRVSYLMDFQGPSMPVDTACSSSLTAVHLACESLKKGSCDAALAGGVNLYLHPSKFIQMSQARILSPTGKTRSFGAGSDGTVPGEGVGVIVLKRLKDAVENKDYIYGVIKGSAIGHGGRTSGYTVPNPAAQSDLIEQVMKESRIDPESIGYVEAHATGTSLGDPIEVAGLTNAYRKYTGQRQFCAIGSVKSNIGHLEAAAGIAGVTKILLQFQHKKLVPSLYAEVENPDISFSQTPFYVQKKFQNWNSLKSPLRAAAISSFGAGGSNAHMILQEYPEQQNAISLSEHPNVVVLSADNQNVLKRYAGRLLTYLTKETDQNSRQQFTSLLVEIIGETLGIDETPDYDEDLSEYGLELADLSEIAAKASAKSGVDVTLDVLLRQKTIRQIVEKIFGDADDQKRTLTISLNSLAYTLQTGRNELAERISFTSKNINEVCDKLKQYCAGKKEISGFYQSDGVIRRKSAPDGLNYSLENNADLDCLAAEWAAGGKIRWEELYGLHTPPVIPLPACPFERERCWISDNEPQGTASTAAEPQLKRGIAFKSIWQKDLAEVMDETKLTGKKIVYFGFADDSTQKLLSADNDVTFMDARPDDFFSWLKHSEVLPDYIVINARAFDLPQSETAISDILNDSFFLLLKLTKILMQARKKHQIKIIYRYEMNSEISPFHEAVTGFAKTLKQEHPDIGLISVITEHEKDSGLQLIREMCADHVCGDEIQYKNGQRYVKKLTFYDFDQNGLSFEDLKEQGVYLITGGLGGLGRIFGQWFVSQKPLHLILSGRADLSQEELKILSTMEKDSDSSVTYIKAELSLKEQVFDLIRQIRVKFGKIDGILHCAGCNRDSYILKKDFSDAEAVFAAKINGTIWLDQATRQDELDFFVMFSSTAGIWGNPGQSDYAYANRFMDSFAYLRKASGRSGKSLSIQWPLWKDGGMKISDRELQLVHNKTGIDPLNSESGKAFLVHAVSNRDCNLGLVWGDHDKLEDMMKAENNQPLSNADNGPILEVPEPDLGQLQNRAMKYLKDILSAITKTPVERLREEISFEDYGLNSLMIVEMTEKMAKVFGKIPVTLLYEYENLKVLSFYLAENYSSQLTGLLNTEDQPQKRQFLSGMPEQDGENSPPTCHSLSKEEKEIAIIGIAGTYPMAENLEEFWENLAAGKDCISEIPRDRWDNDIYFDPQKGTEGKYYSKWGGFIDGVGDFDPSFFQISPKDAELTDPQERLFLKTAWHTIENAGYTRNQLATLKTGVFVGVSYGEYQLLNAEKWSGRMQQAVSSSYSSIANRVSYLLNFTGPSIAVDTMCSSSLTAIHLACQSIRTGECEAALAGGVNLNLHPNKYLQLSQGEFLSTDGRCRSFGEGGDGYVPGEGVGAVLLKPLDKAIRDRDNIYGIIKSSAVNHGGKTNGYTVPNAGKQAEVIAQAVERSGCEPSTISCIEAHGTGTALGDPIEIAGLLKAFGRKKGKPGSCAIGSVKSNIGHLEGAAGIAGLTKIILQMKYKKLVPSINSNPVNQKIDFDSTPFYLQQTLSPWEPESVPRRAGISSFGAGGSNAHMIIEEYTDIQLQESSGTENGIFILSAKNPQRLKDYAANIIAYLKKHPDVNFYDFIYTMQTGREAMDERLGFAAETVADVRRLLSSYLQSPETLPEGICRGNRKKNKENKNSDFNILEKEEMIEKLMISHDYKKLLQLWVEGAEIDWKLLYQNETPHKIEAPVYPFLKQKYWLAPLREDTDTKPADELTDEQLISILNRLANEEISLNQAKLFMEEEYNG